MYLDIFTPNGPICNHRGEKNVMFFTKLDISGVDTLKQFIDDTLIREGYENICENTKSNKCTRYCMNTLSGCAKIFFFLYLKQCTMTASLRYCVY